MAGAEAQTHPADAVAAILRRSDPGIANAVLRALSESSARDDLDDSIWGPAPSAEAYLEACVRNQARVAQNRQQVLKSSITRGEAAQLLGVSPQQISRLVDAGDLVVLGEGRELRLPIWQFNPDSRRGRLEGVNELQAVFPGGPVTLTQWIAAPNPALGGNPPVAEMAIGNLQQVLAAAEAAA